MIQNNIVTQLSNNVKKFLLNFLTFFVSFYLLLLLLRHTVGITYLPDRFILGVIIQAVLLQKRISDLRIFNITD